MSYDPGAVQLKYEGALMCTSAPGFCRAVRAALHGDVTHLELNLEEVKHTDAVGLAALWQATRYVRERGIACSIFPSAVVYRALLHAELLDELPLAGRVGGSDPTEITETVLDDSALLPIAASGRIALRPPAWDELGLFAQWANEPLLDQMVGSPLLYQCRHAGPYHPEFVARVLYDPTALTLLIQSAESGSSPVGFVRLHGIHLIERFAFIETALGDASSLRKGWGVEASRLALAYAMDTLEVHRVEAKVYAYNLLSVNALRRNGFELEGVLREARTYDGRRWDVLVFSILNAEMQAQRARDGFSPMSLWRSDAGT
jgi:RimJ/RimL family protein N-acetyltransferase/ABC-type transporter Mla MlaB component